MSYAQSGFRFCDTVVSAGPRIAFTFLVAFGLLSAIALPSIKVGGLNVYLVTLVSPALFALTLAFWFRAPFFHASSIAPLALGSMVVLSAIASWTVGFSSVNSRDVIEAIKYVQFFPYLMVIVFLTPYSLKVLHKALALSAVIVFIIGTVQVIDVPIIANKVSLLYLGANSSHLDSLLTGSRITITGADPNIGGVIAGFFCIYYTSLYFVSRRVVYGLASLLFLYLCFLTQSRTALIGLVFAFFFYYIFFFRADVFSKFLVFSLGLSSIVFLIFFLDLKYIYIGFQTALEGNNNSLNIRVEKIQSAIQRFMDSPILGIGPAKSDFSTIIDSEYALIIQRYGLLGVFIFSAYLLYLYRLALRNLHSHWGVSLLMFTVMSAVVMITNNIFSGYQLMSLVVILNIACALQQRCNIDSIRNFNLENCPPHLSPR